MLPAAGHHPLCQLNIPRRAAGTGEDERKVGVTHKRGRRRALPSRETR
jgi:hypothetical protein